MSMRRGAAVAAQAARSVEAAWLTHSQSRRTISESLKLLHQPVYPFDRVPPAEQ